MPQPELFSGDGSPSLNPEQEDAVFHPGGPLLVVAGAGADGGSDLDELFLPGGELADGLVDVEIRADFPERPRM